MKSSHGCGRAVLRRPRNAAATIAAVAALGAIGAGAASAAITGTTGHVQQVAPPASVTANVLQSDTRILAFDERQCVTLATSLAVDITPGGGAGTIPAGTSVSSQFLHFDPTGASVVTLSGSVTTDTPVLGVITSQANLDASDSLGAPGTTYPTGDAARDLEPAGPFPADGDSAAISGVDTVTVTLKDRFHFDQVRIISECPSPGDEGCTPGFWKQAKHFDSWFGYDRDESFEAVFAVNVPGAPTLLEALKAHGGGINALERHAVAALLNASSPDVDYPLTVAEVKAKVKSAIDSGDPATIEQTKDELAQFNELGCPLS
jgi:hypothetical protein